MAEEDTAASTKNATDGIPETSGTPGTGSLRGTEGIARIEAVPGTGDARVDEAVAWLGELADAPLEEHPVILGQIHDRLREVLGELGSSAP